MSEQEIQISPFELGDDFKALPHEGFNLYFAGSSSRCSHSHLTKCGCNRLHSQLLDRKLIDIWMEDQNKGNALGKLMIDSGAHTAYYTGQELNVDDYIDYINLIDDHVDFAFQADKVAGSGGVVIDDNDEAPKYNWENYLYMRQRMKSPNKLIPVFHIGEDYSWLKNMLDWRGKNGEMVTYIGIAPRQEDSWDSKIRFMEKCFQTIKKSTNPNVRTHALGMTKLDTLESFPFTSADSTSWIMTAAMGSIMTPFGNVCVSEKSADALGHYLKLPEKGRRIVDEYADRYGMNIEQLSSDYNARAVLNIHYLIDWAKNYKYAPSTVVRKKLF
jgi:hypothetical protein